MLRVVTFGAKLLAVAILVGSFVAGSSASPPKYVYRDVALVAISGHGTVTSKPTAQLPRQVPRALFVRGTHLSLHAVAAPGWRFTGFKSTSP